MREAPGDIVAQIEAEYRARKHARNSEVERLFAGVGNGTSSDCGCHQNGSTPDRVLAVGSPGPRRFGGPPAHIVGLMGRKNRLSRAGGGPFNVSSLWGFPIEYVISSLPEEPCPRSKTVLEALERTLEVDGPFSCRKTITLGSGGAGHTKVVSPIDAALGYVGENVWVQAPPELTGYFNRHTFDSPGAIWTYVKAGPALQANGYATPCSNNLWSDPSRYLQTSFFVHAFVPYVVYDVGLGFDESCGWIVKIKFWVGMVNNFSTFWPWWPDPEYELEQLTQFNLPVRALAWFAGIGATRAKVSTRAGRRGGVKDKIWECNIDKWFGNSRQFLNRAFWNPDHRDALFGSMLVGQVDFYESMWSQVSAFELARKAFSMLFGDEVLFEQTMAYLPKADVEEQSKSVTVQSCASFADVEIREDFLARYDVLWEGNKAVFNTQDVSWIESDEIL
jgi:hypothetical protein